MCTSLTIQTLEQHQFFGRTMDFPTKTPWQLTYLPSHYQWQPKTGLLSFSSQHSILGGMRHTADHFLIGDGINDAGLCCAELYFPVEATYYKQPVSGKINLSPQDFTTWLLSENESIAQVRTKLDQIALVGIDWYDHDGVYPFHWLLTDQTGQTVIIEPTTLSLTSQPDPVLVLTNTPPLHKHITNLNQFLGVAGDQFNAATITAIRQFTGSLPTRRIPTDRFIKAALMRWQNMPTNTAGTLTALFDFLDTVKIPKENDRHDYTHYEGIIDVNTIAYWFKDIQSGKTVEANLATAKNNYSSPHIF